MFVYLCTCSLVADLQSKKNLTFLPDCERLFHEYTSAHHDTVTPTATVTGLDASVSTDKSSGNSSSLMDSRDPTIYKYLLRAYHHWDLPDKAEALLITMKTNGVRRVDQVFHNCVIEGYCKLGRMDDAERLMAGDSGAGANVATYIAMMKVCGGYVMCDE